MRPKEKAEKLVEMYDETLTYLESKSKSKQCALIAVDEKIKELDSLDFYWLDLSYWKDVKNEINKL